MKYFNILEKVVETKPTGESKVYINLLARANLFQDTLSNPLLFYSYDIQDGDTPEIVADKYYGDSYRYWIVLLCNNIIDPLWDWPLSYKNFNLYVESKYGDTNVYDTPHHYEKVITQYDSKTQTTTVNRSKVDETTYNEIIESINSYTFNDSTTTIEITKRPVTIYDYEYELNESKRSIKLLKQQYANDIESQFKKLMA